MERKHNFSAGPAALPVEVLEEAQAEFLSYDDAGASIMEISHRSPQYTAIQESATNRLRSLLGLSSDWHILFLQGGASLQFYQVPLNFLTDGRTADYIVTGSWAKKALAEARLVGNANVAATGADGGFTTIPPRDTWQLTPDAAYVHYTSNNTIFGTQFARVPEVEAPLVCDASSDFLSRPVDMRGCGLVYAGAQKNLGPAGATVVLVRDDFLRGRRQGIATMLDYGTHVEKLFNTPPVFIVYLIEKVLAWLERLGGLDAIQKINDGKAALLYERIDRTDFYRGTADPASRSKMNVTFRLGSEALETTFLDYAKTDGLLALKGHRSVGGIRASLYNACALEAVEALVSFMDEFERVNG